MRMASPQRLLKDTNTWRYKRRLSFHWRLKTLCLVPCCWCCCCLVAAFMISFDEAFQLPTWSANGSVFENVFEIIYSMPSKETECRSLNSIKYSHIIISHLWCDRLDNFMKMMGHFKCVWSRLNDRFLFVHPIHIPHTIQNLFEATSFFFSPYDNTSVLRTVRKLVGQLMLVNGNHTEKLYATHTPLNGWPLCVVYNVYDERSYKYNNK